MPRNKVSKAFNRGAHPLSCRRPRAPVEIPNRAAPESHCRSPTANRRRRASSVAGGIATDKEAVPTAVTELWSCQPPDPTAKAIFS